MVVNLNIIRSVVFVAMATFCALLWSYADGQRRERLRLSANQTALLSDIEEFRFRDSLNGATTLVITMQNREFERNCKRLSDMVTDLNIKIKRLELVSESGLLGTYNISVPVVCDTVLNDSSIALTQHIAYKDNYISLKGVVLKGLFEGEIKTYDTLTQVVHRVPHRFLFFRWGTKELRQEIVCANPHTNITYSRTIKLQR